MKIRQPKLQPPKPKDNPKIKRKYDKRKKEQPISTCQKITNIFKPVSKALPNESVSDNVSDTKKNVHKPVERQNYRITVIMTSLLVFLYYIVFSCPRI